MDSTATRRIAERFARLTSEQRRAVYQKIRSEGLTIGQFPILARDELTRTLCPLTYAQLRQWFLWQLDASSTAYHISGALRLEGTLNEAALKSSFEALVARHESLRTVFRADGEGLAEQWIQPQGVLALTVSDLSDVPDAAERDQQLQQQAQRLSETPFDLTQGPLLRVGLIRLGAQSHVLVVVMHHIISDGWSMQILIEEFAAQYAARVQGDTPPPNPLPIQYADYAVWQRNWLEAGEKDRQLAYWTTQLASDTGHPVLQLPVDHPRRAEGGYRAARHSVELPAALVQGLQQRARTEGVTLFMLLLAGYQALLHRYSGQDDIRVGVPVANRHRVETEGVVGFFVNTQVLRNVMQARTPLADVLRQTREAALGAQAHQDLPFEQLVEALQPERSLGSSPLFQVMFNHQREDYRALEQLPNLTLQSQALGSQAAQFELTLDTAQSPDGRVHASFSHAQELFEPATIERMAGHYLALLDALAHQPQQAVGDVPLLSPAEQQQLRHWGVHERSSQDTLPVHRLIEQHVQAQPQAIALRLGDETLSYQALNQRANRLAHRLIALGVKPETQVGIAVERSIEMVVGLLAILKAGGAYVPLDPAYPAERLARMVQDSGLTLLLTQSHLRDVIDVRTLQMLELDTLALENEPDHNPQVAVHGENLAYVIYTSGSTGQPKGAQLCHRNVSRLLRATQPWFQFGPDDVWTLFHSYAFDFSVWELFGALCTGGQLVIVPFWVSRSPEDFVALLRQHRVTVLNQTPSAFGQLIHVPAAQQEGLALRAVIFGGEALDPQRLRPWIERWGDQTPQLINMYGITETTVHVTYRRVTRADLETARSPVGTAIPDLGLRVLNGRLQAVPVGVPGELYVAGEGLARGYLHRAGLSAERFIADPFDDQGGRLYRTGDLVRWNAEGELEYLGRIDQQVKIRGFRIELGEIEAQLQALPEVREAVVVAREARLIGYVSLHEAIEPQALRERLGRVLPDYMVPAALVVLPALPLNANGKVDRKALPDPQFTNEQTYEPPQGELEEALALLWAEVLGLERVGRQDNFFELGGHSLLALRLLERMRARGWAVQVRTLFQHPALAAFAQALSAQPQRREVVVPPNAIPPGCTAIEPTMLPLVTLDDAQIRRIEAAVPGGAANIQDIYPLAPLQEGILFHHLLQHRGDAYVTLCLLSFDSRARLERFIESFDQVIARHDILRTAVLWEGLNDPVQVVLRHAALTLQWLEEGDAAAERLQASVDPSRYRIDVRQAPMIKAVAVHDAMQDRWLLQLPCHHLVLDHTTLELLVEEIALVQQGRQAELPEPVPFRRYVAQARLGVSQAEHEAFFRQMLGDVDEPTAPFNLLDVQGDGSGVEEVRLKLPDVLSAQVRQQAQRHGVSAATLFHLAWAVVLGKTTGRDDVVFGTVLFGRMQGGDGAERALGLFINTLPLRVRLGARSVLQSLQHTHASLSGLLHHEHAGLSLAQRCSALPGGTPLFSALLNYRYSVQQDDVTSVWEGMEAVSFAERTNYPLELSVDDLGRGFELVTQVVKSVSASRMGAYVRGALVGLVEALAHHPERPVADLDLLGEPEKRQLVQWGLHRVTDEPAEPVHRLIERQAQAHPQATALHVAGEALSYQDLNRRANQLAHRLIALGVKPESRVGVAVERSTAMVVGLLAILKAGGAYVPLDLAYPADRQACILDDSGIDLLLTQSAARPSLQTKDLPVLELDTVDLQAQPVHNPSVPVHADGAAYATYTSGSTGRPKGVLITHRAVHRLVVKAQYAHLDATVRMLQFAPLAFDASTFEIWGCLCNGGTLVVAPAGKLSADELSDCLQHGRVNTAWLTAALFNLMTENHLASLSTLRQLLTGGEAMSLHHAAKALEAFAGTTLINGYGPTESTTFAACHDVRHEDVVAGVMPLGRPIGGTHCRVLDAELNATPVGVAGELYLGGAGLGRGYLHRASLSAERFVADPFDAHGGRLYRTGDLVRWNAEGQIEYLGRIDHQVKIRGFRIELGEVEAQLLDQPEVREAVVVAREARLIGYVSLHDTIEPQALRERLSRVLPDYMVPAALVVLPALPLNANGKVDRKALPDPQFTNEQTYEPPQGELEEALALLWAEVLGLERVGRQDNFFELGGHSLLALRLLERMRARGWAVQVRTLFQHPALAAFAQALSAQPQRREVVVPPNAIPPGCTAIEPTMLPLVTLDDAQIRRIEAAVPGGAANIQDIYPLAPLQEGILFHHLLQHRGDAYVTLCLLSFDSRARLERFIESFDQVIARHDILRTAVLWEGLNDPVQVVLRHAALTLQWLEEGDAAAERLQASVDPSRYRIDVRQAPMIKAVAVHDAMQDRWLLQLPCHHLVLDHTTLELLVEEIALVQQGRQAELPEPVPFRRYVAQARLGVSQAEHEAFFRQMLGDVDEPTAPFNLLDVQGDGSGVEEVRLKLPDALSVQVRQQAQRHGVSAATLFHLAWAVVLGKTTGRDDVVFGTVLFGRMQGGDGAERALGLFINTLPLRVRLGARSVLQSLQHTHASLSGLLHHEHASLSLAQRCSALPGGTPLFSALLNYRYSVQPDDVAPSVWEGMEALGGEERTNYPLGMSVDDLGEGFELAGQVLVSIGAARLCGYMHEAIRGVVQALQERPQQLLCELAILAEPEHRQLAQWGVNERRHADTAPVHRLIERHAQTQPQATALLFGDEALSYHTLNQRANQLAHRLIALGVRSETLVGIAVERSIEMVVGLLAILKAGGAYVPLDPEYPADRLAYMVQDSGIELLLTQSHLRSLIDASALQVLELDTLVLEGEPKHNPPVAPHGENLAYVIYTSGSTGRPKGAANRHHALTSCMQWMQETYGLTRADTVLHKAPFGFDVSVWELFWPLTAGARLVVSLPGDHRDPARLVELIRRHQVSTVNFVPSMLQAFLAHEGIERSTQLKHIICGGEAMPAAVQQEALQRLQGATLQNLYGPTETAIHVTQWTCRDDGSHQVPIGRPISDTQARVLDAELNATPVGVAGELYLGGVSLGRGYLRRAGLSAERFVADPFDTNGGRLYRTGDLVRWNAEGQIEYLGRIDHQVKIRGFRIELGEVEAQLLDQPEVREAVVVAREARLIGYVSLHDTIEPQALRERLSRVLPDYMVPAALVVLPALPLNANGKVDRKALPDPQFTNEQTYEPPQGELEEALATLWAEVLGLERVGRQDNFFELGGHSLLALRLLERMRARGWAVQVRTLFQHPALAAFAQALSAQPQRREVVVPPNAIPPGCTAIEPTMLPLVTLDDAQIRRIEAAVPGGAANIQDIYPLAPLQEGILFHHLLQHRGDAYVTLCLLSFDSRARLERFIESFDQVIARHDILRTAVLWEGLNDPVQVVLRHAALTLQWLEEGDAAAERLQASVDPSRYRIDVRQAPMIKAVAVHDAMQDRWLLQLPCHHLVLDHTTLELLVEEIALVQQGRQAELPEPVPFRRYVAQARLGVSQAEHEAFFRQMLGDVDEPTAPFNLLDVQGDGSGVEEVRLKLPDALSVQVRQQAQRHGVSAATLFHLAWAVVLGKTTGRDDVVFGTVLFGRMQGGDGAERALGLFINTLPLRVRLGARSVLQSLQHTHASLSGLLHHEHASLSLAQRCSALPGGTPLFSALLNYRYSVQPDDVAPSVWEGMEALGGEERTNYPLGMSVDDLGEGFELAGQVLVSIGAARLCGYMHEAIRGVVQALQERPQQLLCELAILAEPEHRQLAQWGVNERRHADTAPVHRLIERHAQTQPQATALLFGDEALSYHTLNQRANQLAHRLIALGVRSETLVGIAVERSIEMVVGLLAILKAGGAYVPLDPEYPADRLAYMVQDSGIELLLTQSHLRSLIDASALQVLELDTLVLEGEPKHNPPVAPHGENLAYVIYTSGSTGRPKGAANRHHALTSCMQWMQETYGLTRADTVLHKAPFGFDVSVWELFWPLTAGARLVVSLPGDHRDPARLVELIRRHQVSTVNFVPSMLQAFLAHEGIERSTQLKHIICGGEAMPAAVQQEALQRLQGATLQNLYGPTETAIHVTQWTCRDDGSHQVPIGRPISDTQARVLDAELNATPVGVAGELYLGGVSLGRGYLHRAGLSAERFVADPFDAHGGRLYRTGDLVRWNAEGQIEYLGRIDHQVKIRGFRIELGEVEAQLLDQPEVREAVVVAREARLIGYVSLHEAIEPQALRERLGRVLPDYMVPAALVVLPALPLNANGKVDRKALPDPQFTSEQTYEAPQGELEEALATLWAQVLGLDRVGRHDNFFEMGGNSISVLRVQAHMQKQYAVPLSLRAYFEHPTLSAIAGLVEAELRTSKADEATDLAQMAALLEALEN